MVEQKKFRVIAVEGNIYGLYKAHKKFIKNGNITSFENSMYSQLNITEMEDLYKYVYDKNKEGDSIIIVGFDARFSGKSYVEDIKEDINSVDFLSQNEKDDFVAELRKANISNLKAVFRNNKKVRSKIVYYSKLILTKYIPKNESGFFFQQTLKNIISRYDISIDTDTQDNLSDKAMVNNIIFLKEHFKNDKIILFGSSTHLLKHPTGINSYYFQNNRRTLGCLLDSYYGKNYHFIAYSVISGKKTNILLNKVKDLSPPIDYSIEFENRNIDDSIFLNDSNCQIKKTNCRFLGHSFLEVELWKVMDGLILIKNSLPSKIKVLED